MKNLLVLSLLIVVSIVSYNVNGQTYWTGYKAPFFKFNHTDWTDAENQDSITSNVRITRDIERGLFNAATEFDYNDGISPEHTLWHEGTFADSLFFSFDDWRDAVNSNPPSSVGKTYVVYLDQDNVLLELTFTYWERGTGGGFSYIRNTPPPTGPKNIMVYGNSEITFPNNTPRIAEGTLFGPTLVGDTVSRQYIIGNSGLDSLRIDSILVDSAQFWLSETDLFPFFIPPGRSDTFKVSFISSMTGFYQGNVRVYSDDPDESELSFSIEAVVAETYDGFEYNFCKVDYANPDSSYAQDAIAENLRLTRADDQGLFNFEFESGYNPQSSPAGTRWVFGDIQNFIPDHFNIWRGAVNRNPPSAIGNPLVVYSFPDNLLLPIAMTQWTQDDNGGGFCYTRPYKKEPGPGQIHLFSNQEIENGDLHPNQENLTSKGPINANTTLKYTFTIGNSGSDTLTIDSITLGSSDFYVDSTLSFPWQIAGSSTATLCINFMGSEPGSYMQTIEIYSDDPDDPVFTAAIEANIPEVWSGFPIPFCKRNWANPNEEINQDRIGPNTWITRANNQGLFNRALETSYDNNGEEVSPLNTLWQFGNSSTLNLASLEFWRDAVNGEPPDAVGQEMVMYVNELNAILDITMTSWTENNVGGGFCYIRSTAAPSGAKRLEVYGDRKIEAGDNLPDIRKGTVFGPIIPAGSHINSFILGNPGEDPLQISNLTLSDTTFSFISLPGLPFNIGPGESDTIQIIFSASDTGSYFATLNIESDDGTNPDFSVALEGKVAQYWNSFTRTFCKQDYADWTQPENQDNISSTVTLTRADDQGIFNIFSEGGFQNSTSPESTLWTFGTPDTYDPNDLDIWVTTVRKNPPSSVGSDMMLFLEEDNALLKLKFTAWTENSEGGGFCYERSAPKTGPDQDLRVYVSAEISPNDTLPNTVKGTDLGCGPLCDNLTQNMIIGNDGDSTLTIDTIFFDTDFFKFAESISFPTTLDCGASVELTISYPVLDEFSRQANVTIVSNDPDYPVFNFRVMASQCQGELWNGYPILFCKENYADTALTINQDSITDDFILTRGDRRGLFNIAQEPFYSNSNNSPEGTVWKFENKSDPLSQDTFVFWRDYHDGAAPRQLSGNSQVLLEDQEKVIRLKMVQWTPDAAGGGFCYFRSTAPIAGNSELKVSHDLRPIVHNSEPSYLEGTDIYAEVGGTAFRDFTLHNQGSDTLMISGLDISSADVSLVTQINFPLMIMPNKWQDIRIKFTPTATEKNSENSTITISNDGQGENSYALNIKLETTQPEIWDGPSILFCKDGFADFKNPDVWDQVSPLLALTRMDQFQLYNPVLEFMPIARERQYSPAVTKWARGSLEDDVISLNYGIPLFSNGSPREFLDQPRMLFNYEENYYAEVTFTEYSSGSNGGGFCYLRSTKVDTTNPDLIVFGNGILIPDENMKVSTKDGTDFGMILNGSLVDNYFTIVNQGSDPITINELGTNGAAFNIIESPDLPFILSPGESQIFKVEFSPTSQAISTWEGSVFLKLDYPQNPLYTFAIEGTGLQPFVWMGDPVVFEKTDYADWTQPENQDLLTSNVSLTRQNNRGIYNTILENGYRNNFSPQGTLWSYGTTDQFSNLNLRSWEETHDENPPDLIGEDVVVYLQDDNEAFDLSFFTWTSNNNGGGFGYTRTSRLGVLWNNKSAERDANAIGPPTFNVYACDPNPVELSLITPVGYDWTWSPSTSLDRDTGIVVIWTPDAHRTYSVMGIDGLDTIRLKIKAIPRITCDLVINADLQPLSTCDSVNGNIMLTVDSAAQPVTYKWSNGSAEEDQIGIGSGNYIVTISDECGCEEIRSFEIESVLPDTLPSLNCPEDVTANNNPGTDHTFVNIPLLDYPDSLSFNFEYISPVISQNIPEDGATIVFEFPGIPGNAINPVDINVFIQGDFNSDSENVSFYDRFGNLIGFSEGSDDQCDGSVTEVFTIPVDLFNQGSQGGTYEIRAITSSSVGDFCDNNEIRIDFSFVSSSPYNDQYPAGGRDASGIYPIGETVVTFILQDTCGQTSTCTTNVTVYDTENPVARECPDDITLSADSAFCGAIYDYDVLLEDNTICQPTGQFLTMGLLSMDTFPVGTTPVFYEYSDPSGNSGSCSFNVTVTGDPCCDLEITDVIVINEADPNTRDGEIEIMTSCSTCIGDLEYSIDNGQTWSDYPTFYNLSAGNYGIRVRDKANTLCQDFELIVLIENCAEVLNITADPIPADTYHAGQILNSGKSVAPGTNVIFKAGLEINLLPGFTVEPGASFEAAPDDCVE